MKARMIKTKDRLFKQKYKEVSEQKIDALI